MVVQRGLTEVLSLPSLAGWRGWLAVPASCHAAPLSLGGPSHGLPPLSLQPPTLPPSRRADVCGFP